MKKTLKQLIVMLLSTSLIACGGGGSDVGPTTSQPADVAASPPTATAAAVDAASADNPSRMGAASNDARRIRESDGKYKVVPPTVVAQEFKGEDPEKGRVRALAANDPVQLPMGATAPIAPVPAQGDIPANAGQTGKGMWGKVYDWPLIPIHFAQMPDGRIMSYGTNEGGRQTGKTIYDIFDPKDGLFNGHMTIPKDTLSDVFCSATLFLPITNQMLTVGGDNLIPDASSPPGFTNNLGNNSSNIFTPSTNKMVAGKNMALPRWYATTTTLLNGTTFIQGGLGGEAYPELRLANGTFKSMTGADTSNLDYWYPRNWVAPNGKIFGYDVYGNYYYITTTGTGAIQIIDQWDVDSFGEAGSATMYAPGKVLNIAAFSKKVSIVDFSGATPTYTATSPLPVIRQNGNLVTLPNGKVLVAGGSSVYNSTPAEDPTSIVSYDVMTWDPATGVWTQGPSDPAKIPRLYHSIGVLQADGSVVIGGGGAYGPVSNTNISFYYPDYLFNANGTWATKPQITAAPTTMDYGKTIQLTVDDTASGPITKITMTKTFAQTHSLNMESNWNNLPFTRAGNVLTVTLPTVAEAWKATPGYYMIFAQTAKGTPAQARIIRMNVPNADVAAPTAVTASIAGTTVTVKWTQSATAGVTRNILVRGTSATGPFTDVADITAAVTFALTNQPVGTYFYGVKAVVGTTGNVSPVSNIAQIGGGTPPPTQTVPTATQGVSATYAAATGVTINWTNPTATTTMPAVTSVKIARGTAAAGPFTALATLGAVQTYVDNLQTAGTYYYTVTPINSVGAGPATTTNAVTITTAPPVTVNPPTGFSGYTCGAGCWTTDNGVRVNWTLSNTAGVTAQTVQRATAAAGPFTTVATLAANAAVYVDKNVVNGTTYYYQVAATAGTSTSAYGKLGYGITSNITLGGGATAPTSAKIVATPATGAQAGQAISLSGSTSVPANGASIVAYEWSITANTAGAAFVGAINAVTASVNTTQAGSFTANLKVTDNQGGVATNPLVITVVAAPAAGAFSIVSQEQTKYLVMNWWRGDPAVEGNFRQPGICTGAASQGGNCTLGARKLMKPQAFNIATAANNPAAVTGLTMMDVPQFDDAGNFSYAHYRLPIEFIKNGCSLKVQHIRTHSSYEFPLAPPGLEILDHKINLTQALCDSYPAGAMTQAWLDTFNTALTTYLGAKVNYVPDPYPYSDPRTGKDPSQP